MISDRLAQVSTIVASAGLHVDHKLSLLTVRLNSRIRDHKMSQISESSQLITYDLSDAGRTVAVETG